MKVILPLTTPQYMNVQTFINYGFFTGTATQFMLDAAFSIAENQVAREVGTFLAPTTFTGTFSEDFSGVLVSPVGKINSVNATTFVESYANNVERLISGTSRILDPFNGFFNIWRSADDNSSCGGCGSAAGIFRADVVINAGYATGVALTPMTLLGTCLAADIALQEMMDRGMAVEFETFQTTLQIGRSIMTNLNRYVMETPFGYSQRAGYIRTLLKPYKIERTGKL